MAIQADIVAVLHVSGYQMLCIIRPATARWIEPFLQSSAPPSWFIRSS